MMSIISALCWLCLFPCHHFATTDTIEGYGTFTFTMAAYTTLNPDSTLSGQVTTFPILIPLRERLYFRVTVNTPENLNLSLNIVDVVATSGANMSNPDALQYKIVDNGCVEDSSYQTVTIADQNAQEQVFSVEIFEFASQGGADVYIHAGVVVCEENATECGATCGGEQRRKRSEEEEEPVFTYNGPFVLMTRVFDDNDAVSGSRGGNVFVGLSLAWGVGCSLLYWIVVK